jgi:zinc transporter
VIDADGRATPVGWAQAPAWSAAAPDEMLWLHLDRTVPDVLDWLADAARGLGLSEATVEALISNENRPRAFREGDTLVTILRGINFNPDAQLENMVAMQMWCDGTRVVTLRRQQLQTPFDVLATIERGRGPRTAGDLFTELVEQTVAKMNRSVVDMNDRIDELEEADDADPVDEILDTIADIRRNCLALKRYMSPQHEALQPHAARDRRRIMPAHDQPQGSLLLLAQRPMAALDLRAHDHHERWRRPDRS